jgi:lauroyl/myristoyl acyltransferase
MTLQGLVITGLLRLFGILPLPFSLAVGAALGSLLYRIPNRNLRLARRNIELCFPELEPGQQELLVRDSLRSTAQTFLELGWFWYRKPERIFGLIRKIHGLDVFEQACKAGQGQFAPFFGIEALTMVLLSKLAQKTDCKVLFGWAERLPGGAGYDFHFSDASAQISDPDQRVAVTALNQGVEQCVRQCPAQYQWGYKRFGIRPDGESELY